jgi:hypothetical protein
MAQGAETWIVGQPAPSVESFTVSDDEIGNLTLRAYVEQSALGWNCFYRGFLTSTWRAAQEEYWRKTGKRDCFATGESWSGKVQLWIFDLFSQLWDLRNSAEHGDDIFMQRQIRRNKCERTIRRLYARSVELPEGETYPFRDPLESLLQRPVTDQELWIHKTVPFLRLAFRRAKKRKGKKQRAITEFFTCEGGVASDSATTIC